jgi:xylulokinase
MKLPPMNYGQWCTQSPATWFKGTAQLLDKAHLAVGVDNVEAIAITSTAPTLVFLDEYGRLVCDKAIMWCDTALKGRANAARTNVGLRKLAAIGQRSPRLMEATQYIADAGDYLRLLFTGRLASSKSVLSQMFAWSSKTGFDYEGLDNFDMEKLTGKLSKRLIGTGEIVGELRQDAMCRHGMKKGAPVVACAYDTASALIGGGLCEPSDAALLNVSSILGLYVIPTAQDANLGPWPMQKYLLPTAWKTAAGGCEASFQSIDILLNKLFLLCQSKAKNSRVEAELVDAESRYPYNTFALPFGNLPLAAPFHRNLPTLISTTDKLLPSNLGLLVAILRGVSYFLRRCIEDLRSRGVEINRIHVVGGGSKSPSFCQLIASVCGLPVYSFGENAAAKGAAILAAAAASGRGASCENLVLRLHRGTKRYEPDDHRRSFYEAGYEIFTSHLDSALLKVYSEKQKV